MQFGLGASADSFTYVFAALVVGIGAVPLVVFVGAFMGTKNLLRSIGYALLGGVLDFVVLVGFVLLVGQKH